MRGRGGGDHDTVDAGCQQRLHRIDRRGTVFGGDRRDESGRSSVMTRPSSFQAAEGFGVERADAAEPDHAECGHGILRSSWSRNATSSASGLRSSANAASTVST